MRGGLLHLIRLAVLLPLPLLAKEPTRLAVVDVGVSAKVPAMFLDLLMVELGKHAELALLERTEVAQLLREQSQSLLMSGPLKADDFVKAGRLWAADAFLMLQANPAKEGQFLRIKLIDTRYGLGLWDTTILLDKDLKNCAPQAEKVARSSSQRAHKLSCSPDDPVLIGVTGFRSEELSSRWAWLAEALTTGMEQHLGLQARMVVLERLKTRPLMEERGLASGLPAALRASSVFVDGSYRINREKGPEVLSVRIRCRRPAAPILELALDGSVNEIAELSSNAAAAIVTALGADTSCESLDAGTEAQMLAEDAQAYLTRDEPEQAWPRAEAAVALSPRDPSLQRLLLTTITRTQDNFQTAALKNRLLDDENYLHQMVKLSSRGLVVAEQLMRRQPTDRQSPASLPVLLHEFFNSLMNWYREPRDQSTGGPAIRAEIHEVAQSFLRLAGAGLERNAGHSPAMQELMLYYLNRAFPMCGNAEEAIALSRRVVAASAKTGTYGGESGLPGLSGLVRTYASSQSCRWVANKAAGARIAAYLDEMTQADDPVVRLFAEEAAMELYGGPIEPDREFRVDYAAARVHAKKFIALLKSEFYEKRPDFYFGFNSELRNPSFAANAQQDTAFKAELFQELLPLMPARPAFHRQPEQLQYAGTAEFVASASEQAGKLLEASAILENGIARLAPHTNERERLQTAWRELKRRHPELDKIPDNGGPSKFQTVVVCSSRENPLRQKLKGGTTFLRLAVDTNGVVVCCSQGSRYGILTLHPVDFHRLSFVDFPVADRQANRNGDLTFGCAQGSAGVGVPEGGVLLFPKNSEPIQLNEEHGLASDSIRSLDVLDGKVYAVVGSKPQESGLMEIDWQTRQSRILFSTRVVASKNNLNGRQIRGIAGDSKRHILWLVVGGESRHVALFQYDPTDGKVVPAKSAGDDPGVNGVCNTVLTYARRQDDDLLVWGMGGAFRYALGSGQYTSLILDSPCPPLQPRWLKNAPSQLRNLILLGQDIICVDQSRLLWFRNGQDEPVDLLDRLEPRAVMQNLRILDLAVSEQGLLLLTQDTLFLVPDFKLLRPER